MAVLDDDDDGVTVRGVYRIGVLGGCGDRAVDGAVDEVVEEG